MRIKNKGSSLELTVTDGSKLFFLLAKPPHFKPQDVMFKVVGEDSYVKATISAMSVERQLEVYNMLSYAASVYEQQNKPQ